MTEPSDKSSSHDAQADAFTAEWAELGRAGVDGVVVVDASGTIRLVNDIAAAMWKRAREQIVGQPLRSFLLPSVEVLRQRATGSRVDAIARTPSPDGRDGAEIPVHVWLRAGEHGNTAIVMRDASEWEVAKSTLNLVAAGVEHAADAFEITDADGHIEYANAAHAVLTGYSLFEVIGERINRFVDDDVAKVEIERSLAAGAPFRGEVRCTMKTGAVRFHDLVITPVLDGRGSLQRFVGVRRDITDRVEIEREAEALRGELAMAERTSSMGRLAASVAHEINNPATSILANVEVARDEAEQLAREIELARISLPGDQLAALEQWWRDIRIDERLTAMRETLTDSWESTERVVLLVRELRKLVRPEPPKNELVVVNDVVRAAARVAGPHFYGRASLRLDLQNVARVMLDRRQLGQVVIATLIHAAQSIPPGNETANLCSLRTKMIGSEVVLVVEDTGASLSPDQLPRVFDPFFTKRFGDAGSLGLAVSRDVVEAAGGRIGIESDSTGNRITVRFPAADDSHVAH